MFAARRQADRPGSREREDATLDRCRRACGNRLRRTAPLSARRGSHPENRPEDGPCCSPRFRRPAAAVTRASRGPKEHSGWDSIGNRRDPSGRSPNTGAILRTIESGPASSPGSPWVDGELWHGTWGRSGAERFEARSILEQKACWRAGLRVPHRRPVFPGWSPMAAMVLLRRRKGRGRSGTIRRPRRGFATGRRD